MHSILIKKLQIVIYYLGNGEQKLYKEIQDPPHLLHETSGI